MAGGSTGCAARGAPENPPSTAPSSTAPAPYAHLREEFEHRLTSLQQADETPDPRDAQIARLKGEITTLKERITRSQSTVEELTDFRARALDRLAAQHEEIVHLRETAAAAGHVTRLPTARSATIGSCS